VFTINIERWVPKFILNDKNGYAIAKAIETAMQTMNDIVAQGLACVSDFYQMPEWRLDEMAWEYNILYDYNADVETKRGWIANALKFYSLYGTAEGIVQYLEAAFDSASVEEWFDYGGDPFHFRVNATGEWSEEAEAWAMKSIEAAKNVRSVLDTITFNTGDATATLTTLAAAYAAEIIEETTAS